MDGDRPRFRSSLIISVQPEVHLLKTPSIPQVHETLRCIEILEMLWYAGGMMSAARLCGGNRETGSALRCFKVELKSEEQRMYVCLVSPCPRSIVVAGGHLRRLQRDDMNSCLSAAGWDEYEALTTDCFLGSSTIGSHDEALHADVDIYPNARRCASPSGGILDARVPSFSPPAESVS